MQANNQEFEITKRRGLVVWVYSLKQLKNLRKYGVLYYVSRRMKYVILYLNEESFEQTEKQIEKLHFVRKVERSYRPDIEMNFADKIGTRDAYPDKEDGFEVEELNTTIRLAENI
ncbi:MAG: YlbG family protein [Enterococcus sp.]